MKSEDWSGGIGDILGKMAGPLKVLFLFNANLFIRKYLARLKTLKANFQSAGFSERAEF